MKLNYKSALLALALAAVATACSDDNKWAPGPEANADCPSVYFAPLAKYTYEIEADDSHILSVPVARANYDEAITVPLTVSESLEGAVIPASVSFAAGQKSTTLDIDLNSVPRSSGAITVELDSAYVSPYGAGSQSITLNVTIAGQWVSIGTADVTYDYRFPAEQKEIYNLEGTVNFKIDDFLGSGLPFVFTCADASGKGDILPLRNYWYCIEEDPDYSYDDSDFWFYDTKLERWPDPFSPDGTTPAIEYLQVFNSGYSWFQCTNSRFYVYFSTLAYMDNNTYPYIGVTFNINNPATNPFKAE